MNDQKKAYPLHDFYIRDYRPGDWAQIELLWTNTGIGGSQRADDENSIEETLRFGGKFMILVQKSTGKIAGTSWITSDGRRLHLHHMAVDPALQGNGLSHLLMEECLVFAASKNVQIKLEVHKLNHVAVNLYKKWGFQYLGDYDVYIIRNPAERSGKK